MNYCKLCGEYIPPMYEHTHECRKSFTQKVIEDTFKTGIEWTPIDNSSYDAPSSDNYDSGSSSSDSGSTDFGGGDFSGSGASGDY